MAEAPSLGGYGYGFWLPVVVNVLFFALFLAFIPFKRKTSRLPASLYLAFMVALFTEMYGFPLTIFILTWYFGYSNPLTHESGHLLYPGEGMASPLHLLSNLMIIGGILLVMLGWKSIHGARAQLVTTGLYQFTRHPQYLGILLVTSGLLLQWLTIPTAVMWPILAYLYYRLARMEERAMEESFGNRYREYKRKVPMFIPFLKLPSRG